MKRCQHMIGSLQTAECEEQRSMFSTSWELAKHDESGRCLWRPRAIRSLA